jgi:hypothetical protein
MGFYEMGVFVDSFEPGADGLIRARREDVFVPIEIGQVVSVDCDEVGGFARVVKFEGDAETGWVCLQELLGEEAEQAAKDLELSYEDWCDPLDK